MNQKNSLGLNACFLDLDDPFDLFEKWMSEAVKKEINDPNAFSLGTASKAGVPSVRTVLLKSFNSKVFIFYTNLTSPKSIEIKENPRASMCFYWKSLLRQVRIKGNVKKVKDDEADRYFSSRPYESKISAWVSNQSFVMQNRTELNKKIEEFTKKYNEQKKVPRPSHWSGWSIDPQEIEFWLQRENRIHERLRYKKQNNKWKKEILYP